MAQAAGHHAGLVMALALAAAGCGDDDEGSSGGGSARRRRRRPTRSPSCCPTRSRRSAGRRSTGRSSSRPSTTAGVPVEIQNAEGDKSTQQQQAEQAITNGAKVLLLVNLDSGSGAAIAANAKSQGVKVIDYDRLTLDTDATDYYVSFDNEKVGQLQGQGLVDCLGDAARSPRSPSSTARRPTTTRRCSRRATTRSSTRSSSPATGPRSPTSPCPTGTTSAR